MCILFMYVGANDAESDYELILISNRDEQYDRPTQTMAPWDEDPHVIGGRDLEAGCGGTWLAISPQRRKIGVLLNLPGVKIQDALSRGKIVADFVKSDVTPEKFVDIMKGYFNECNEFVLVTVTLGVNPTVQTYTNATNKLTSWQDEYLGFSNSLPGDPLEKVKAGREKMKLICGSLKKIHNKDELVDKLVDLLKSEERNLPDPILETNRPPGMVHYLSSIFVRIPELRYGTRTHTLILVTKTGQMDVIELNLQHPIGLKYPQWERKEYQFLNV